MEKLKQLLFLFNCFLFFLPSGVKAQESTNFHFKKIQVENGLSESTVYCILQDSKGFMWFGTKDGLNRYDGINFRIYRHEPENNHSIGNNFIRSIAEGENNLFYIGTDNGLYIMNTVDETFSKINTTIDGEAIHTAVNALYIENESNLIWIGTMSQGVFTYNILENTLKKVDLHDYNLGSNAVWTFVKDRSGTIWVGTRLGLLRYNADIDRLVIVKNIFSHTNGYEHEILSIKEDDKGHLWLGTWADGLRCFNKQSNEYVSFMKPGTASYISHIRSILGYKDNILLVGSDDGLYLFDINKAESKRVDIPQFQYSLSDQNIYSIADDREGGIWIGTYFGGVNYLNTSQLTIETYYPDVEYGLLSGKAVSQFCEDKDGNLWIATEDGGVNYLNVKTKEITQPVKTSYHNTHALLLDDDQLWIGTFSRGLDIYDLKTKTLKNYRHKATNENTLNDDCIFSIYKTRKGNIYVGTPVGLNKYDKSDNNFKHIPQVSAFVYDMKEDDFGNLWIATYGSGVIRLEVNTNKWIHYDTIQQSDNTIVGSKLTSIYIDNQKRLIFTSEGRGIFIYDYKTDKFKNITEADGLPNNVVYGILDDPNGNLWLSCNKGLVCFNISDPSKSLLYGIEDGLQSNQFNYKSSFKSRDGKFYFGGINGFSCFYPNDLLANRNKIIPHVEITNISLLGNSNNNLEKEISTQLNKNGKIILPYNKSSFTISYVGLSYTTQTKNRYAYMMDGVDKEWNDVGINRQVTYVNLPPGKYTFKVKASNNSGLWNEQGAEIDIQITPPIWLTIPAKLIYIILIVILLYLIFSFYMKRNKEKQQRQLEAFKAEQETISFKSKINFFTTIAHEIRTPLSLINAPLEEVIASGEGGEETKRNLSVIEKNCNRLTDLINQLLDFRKMDSTQYIISPETIDLKEFISELYEQFRKTAQHKNITFELLLPSGPDIKIISDPDALNKIIGNLLTNAIKYTTNKIVIRLTTNKENSYTISIEDNGRGISDEYKSLIFDPFYQVQVDDRKIGTGIGLSLAKNLSELLKGKIEVKDIKSGGSIFLFTFSGLVPEKKEIENQEEILSSSPLSISERKNTILVVDDNSDMAYFIQDSLKKLYVVETAFDANEALKILEEKSCDLIISDIMMPEIDGISFTKKIKADLNYSHIPVILLSARTENATKIKGLHSGADVFIEKPFSISYLKAQISSLLENRKAIQDAFNRSPLASYSSLTTNKNDEQFLNKLNEEIEKHLSDEDFSVESLIDVLGISRSNLQRKLKSVCGSTPGDYLRNYRLKRACRLLLESDLRINEVAHRVGFNSASYFTKAFVKLYKITPKEFINSGNPKS